MRNSVRPISAAVIALQILAGGLTTAGAGTAFTTVGEASEHCHSDTIVG